MIEITDSHFDRIYNEAILEDLRRQYGTFPHYHVELLISSQNMLNLMAKMNKKRRRGEVVMVVPNQQGHLWLHTKSFYPEGIYRLMTGGIDPGEKPVAALKREVREETGFKTEIERCLATITYALRSQSQAQPFVSYLFLTQRVKASPAPLDDDENIAAFQAVPVAGLAAVTAQLRQIEGEFADWGKFRAVAHEVVRTQLT